MVLPPFKIRALGEIAIRCADIDAMFEFYHTIIGLDVLRDTRGDGLVFFRVSPSFGGHTAVLALFSASGNVARPLPFNQGAPETGPKSSLHHLALTVAFEEQDGLITWLTMKNVAHRVERFDWIGWRGIFVDDPEGNTVEFVAADPSRRVSGLSP